MNGEVAGAVSLKIVRQLNQIATGRARQESPRREFVRRQPNDRRQRVEMNPGREEELEMMKHALGLKEPAVL